MENFECHVTVVKPTLSDLLMYNTIAKAHGWKTSAIEGDPVLGDQVWFYFTYHSQELATLKIKMDALCASLGPAVVRRKIEQIILDERMEDPRPFGRLKELTEEEIATMDCPFPPEPGCGDPIVGWKKKLDQLEEDTTEV